MKAMNVITFDAFSNKKELPKEADIKLKLSKIKYVTDNMPKEKYEYLKNIFNDETIKKSSIFRDPLY